MQTFVLLPHAYGLTLHKQQLLFPSYSLRRHVAASILTRYGGGHNLLHNRSPRNDSVLVSRCATASQLSASASASLPPLAPSSATAPRSTFTHVRQRDILLASKHDSRSRKALLAPMRVSSGRSTDGGWTPNPMELVRREAGLQSNRLEPGLRERVEEAVERLGGRVTVTNGMYPGSGHVQLLCP